AILAWSAMLAGPDSSAPPSPFMRQLDGLRSTPPNLAPRTPNGSHSPSSSAPRRSSARACLTNSWSRVWERARTSRFQMQSDGRWALIEDLLPRPALAAGWDLSVAGHACAGGRPAAASPAEHRRATLFEPAARLVEKVRRL